jgi:crotonobetainyl-CoA:carnitine CoA-transferase CaiB-like acyl-CoA transferase
VRSHGAATKLQRAGNAMTEETPADAPVLGGIRVLDVASFIAGPAAATIMADFGAEVIKIEPPDGDPYRHLSQAPGNPNSEIDYHWQVDNRNKKGLVLDLSRPEGQAVLHRLAAGADVLITNYTRPARQRLKLTYEDIAPLNERLVYASMTAYGEDGPEAERTGFDTTAYWARSGLMHMVRPDPDGPPARSLPGMGDHPTASALFGAIMLALYRRQITGRGGRVHSSLMANGLWSNAFLAQAALTGVPIQPRPVREKVLSALSNHYRCRDGHWFILSMVRPEREWDRLLQAIRREDLNEDERFAVPENRVLPDNMHALIAILDDAFGAQDWAYWRPRLLEYRITFGDVTVPDSIPHDPQMMAGGAVIHVDDSRFGADRTIDSPIWLDGAPKRPPAAAPAPGEHSDEVLRGAGYDAAEIAALRRGGIVA